MKIYSWKIFAMLVIAIAMGALLANIPSKECRNSECYAHSNGYHDDDILIVTPARRMNPIISDLKSHSYKLHSVSGPSNNDHVLLHFKKGP